MPLGEKIFGLLGSALLLGTFVGLVVRKRWRLWYAFTLYLPVVAAFSIAFVAIADWYRFGPYVLKENVLNAVRLAMALELAARTFRDFPGARSTLRASLVVLLVATVVVLVTALPRSTDAAGFLTALQPLVLYGAVWMFTVIAALILWYRLPVHPFHKSILMPYVPYLIWDAVYLSTFLHTEWDTRALRYFNQVLYIALVLRWAWVAWRVDIGSESRPPGPFPAEELELLVGAHR